MFQKIISTSKDMFTLLTYIMDRFLPIYFEHLRPFLFMSKG
ncbi:hypothetical protein [Moraxella phage Mcat24]|uniref:Uncharacterized protein n=1 Tax=Moraxella catarrhalis TaxID=480 RepID=A0ABY0BLJ4_MORCA|nr:hypothetical protein [Moraxella phage Mcat19]AKI27879.1 hypothetical protein [Moraxella phage Mcat21]AKI27924.1 hypothetical protein [Moraxella phage Mcat22]AKI28035.1 hypothetical protein [Moraxella phage Mcat24]AKI28085.1 hypothetical protein [Moraxella phage Mcat25]AKI28137.1 hypothetical protein [Moraxella phage Mcat26]AKI28191.1 hypothetical protein [Moraxella phage Mcat27]AKI28274.1 hypothetical protein [Moraxella phage Mcat28]AKI28325.1 hypothetical protein [Moraxella phage Mcat29